MDSKFLSELSVKIHEQNKLVGWWDNNPDVRVKGLLIITELAEAIEAWRKDKMDDHLPERKGEEVELADALIRTLDIAAHMQVSIFLDDVEFEDEVMGYTYATIQATRFIVKQDPDLLSTLVSLIIELAKARDLDLKGATLEKMQYNKDRLDHKRENRDKDGGKKF